MVNPRVARVLGRIDLRRLPNAVSQRASTANSLGFDGVEVVWRSQAVEVVADGGLVVVSMGEPRFDLPSSGDPAPVSPASAWRFLYTRHGPSCVERVKGAFALVLIDLEASRVIAATDRFGIYPICYSSNDGIFAFSDRSDEVPSNVEREVEPQALLDYFYFHVIPAPRTIFRGIQRLDLGHTVVATQERAVVHRYWRPVFREDSRAPFTELKHQFRQLLRTAVAQELDRESTGAFLSGGTDSSTIAGLLCKRGEAPARTFSIGFEAEGYDEMRYARIAARHFGTEHHEYYVTPEDLLANMPAVARHYDQPFGNSSALAAYCCARSAKDAGITKLLAGDGGDELFGGNSRYAMQRIFEAYGTLPRVVREWVTEPVLGQAIVEKIPVVRKAASYVRQAKTPMPARLNNYNQLVRLGITNILTSSLLDQVDVGSPALQEASVYSNCNAASLTNRMLAFDWKYTLSDNDLPKVRETAQLAGVRVGFPMLSDELVDFSLSLAPELKVRGLRLRWFFKEALRDFLPEEIIHKKKHGFGLPFGPWLTRHKSLFEFAADGARALASRKIVRMDFVDELLSAKLHEHPGYYGEMVWLIVMLEHWLRAHAPDFALEK